MSETRVTINLGRAGQVVKRSGSKQFSDGFLSATKRPRVDELIWSPVGNRFNAMSEDSWGTQYDLRSKLNQKRRMEELRKRHQRAKQLKPVQRRGIANMRMLEHQAKGSNLLRQYPSNHPDNSKQKYLLFQTEDGSRVTPQGRTLNSSKRPGTLGRLRRVPVIRAADVSRDTRVLSNEVYHASRPTPIATMKAAAQFTKPVASIGYIMPKRPAMGVHSFLHSLGLGKYISRFEAEEVDMDALKQMSDKDLTNLGVPMGPRIKILRALKASVKQQPS